MTARARAVRPTSDRTGFAAPSIACRTLLVAAAATVVASLLALIAGTNALFFDDLQELFAAFGGAAALGLAAGRAQARHRRLIAALAVALGGAGAGMVAWDLSGTIGSWLTVAGDVVFVASACLGVVIGIEAIFAGIRPDRLVGIAIDTLIVFLAGSAVVAALWQSGVVASGERTGSIGAVILVAAAASAAFGLVARRIGRSSPGPWILLAGVTLLGVAWLLWIAKPSSPSSVEPSDFMFSAAMLLIALGGIGWSDRASEGPWIERVATVSGSLLPVAAILGSIALLGVVEGAPFASPLGLATAALVATAAVRQLHLYSLEARSRAALEARTAELQEAVAALELEIAERKRLEEEREAMQARLLQSQRLESIGRLAGGVAHDFNNLLTAIQGYADLVDLRLPASDEGHADVEEIRRASGQAASLTRKLLAFSRNQELRPSVVDLGDVVSGTEPLLRRLLGERITLVVHTSAGLWPVLVDPGQFEAIVVNLAVNARDAMESGGTLTIETANVELDERYARSHPDVTPGQYAMVAVSDTGIGMDAETLGQIFEPFFTTKGPGGGTGLGLPSVYGTVRQSGGHVSVYSELGHGSTFKVFLPRTERAGEPETQKVEPGFVARGGRETVLVAEDEEPVRHMIVEVLERHGYSVVPARTGEEALEALRADSDRIGVLLTDVVMPGIGGLELIEAARQLRPNLPAVCMSGYTPVKLAAHEQPPDVQFLPKPFTLARLDEVLRTVLGG